ncbi:MAG TPA: hypothetical protein VFG50_00645 [Rhodothermales bacterium]|nr:hypothetical protein [Rhodothermales bacterium]
MPRSTRHPNKEIRKAVAYALEEGWRLVEPGRSSHAWGLLLCSGARRGACRVSVWSTPKVPEHHAQDIIKAVDSCEHRPE